MAVVLLHSLGRDGHETLALPAGAVGLLLLEDACNARQKANDELGPYEPGDNPPELVVGIVRIQIRRAGIVKDTNEHAADISDQESELG